MNKEGWKAQITEACEEAGTYKPFFDAVIETLAKILEDRDKADSQYEQSGSNPTIIHTNKAKEKNIVKNPILVMRNELNAQALTYWKELGLTPKGLRAMTDENLNRQVNGGLEKLLSKIDG